MRARALRGRALRNIVAAGDDDRARPRAGENAMLYELRLYRIAAGWMDAMHERMAARVIPLFRELGMPHPVGAWEATAGPALPRFVWMIAWRDYAAREKAWAEFAPRWQKVRGTGASVQFVTGIDVALLAAWPEIAVAPNSVMGAGVDELWLQRIAVTQGPQARASFLAADRPALEKGGAALKIGFDFVSGAELPRIGTLMSWPDAAARTAALAGYEASPAISGQRRSDMKAFGAPIFEAADRFLLSPQDYARP